MGVVGKRFERGNQSRVVQQGRAQLAREGLHFAERILDKRAKPSCALHCLRIHRRSSEATAQDFGMERQRGEALADLVMEFEGDLAALSLMRA